MTPNDLYQMTPEKEVTGDISPWVSNHTTEFEDLCFSQEQNLYNDDFFDITTKYYKDFVYDGIRSWTLGSVWYLGSPVMIFQSAGRTGTDHKKRFITDEKLYRSMIDYILSKLGEGEVRDLCDVVNAKDDIKNLTYFYNQDLSEPFKKW